MESDNLQKPWYRHQTRHPLIEIAFVFICIYLLVHFAGPLVINSSQNDLFTVSGTGEAKGTPTGADFSVGVTKSADTQQDASDQMNTTTNKIVSDLKTLGIDQKDIQTTNYTVYPNTETQVLPYQAGGAVQSSKANGYTATQTIQVKTSSIDLANKALAKATEDGADVITNVSYSFQNADEKSLEQQARIAAIKDAKTKAAELAKEAGISLGRIVNISEDNGSVRPMALDSAAAKSTAGQTPDLNPGQNTTNVTVTLSYETR